MRKAIVSASVISRMILRVMKLRKVYTGDKMELESEVALLGPEMEVMTYTRPHELTLNLAAFLPPDCRGCIERRRSSKTDCAS